MYDMLPGEDSNRSQRLCRLLLDACEQGRGPFIYPVVSVAAVFDWLLTSEGMRFLVKQGFTRIPMPRFIGREMTAVGWKRKQYGHWRDKVYLVREIDMLEKLPRSYWLNTARLWQPV